MLFVEEWAEIRRLHRAKGMPVNVIARVMGCSRITVKAALTSAGPPMVTGYSRWLSAVLIPTRTAEDLFAGWWGHLQTLGAVPQVLVWDGEGTVGRWRGGRGELTEARQGCRGTSARDTTAQLTFLTRALKAPTLPKPPPTSRGRHARSRPRGAIVSEAGSRSRGP